jgi:hypothetical protein
MVDGRHVVCQPISVRQALLSLERLWFVPRMTIGGSYLMVFHQIAPRHCIITSRLARLLNGFCN